MNYASFMLIPFKIVGLVFWVQSFFSWYYVSLKRDWYYAFSAGIKAFAMGRNPAAKQLGSAASILSHLKGCLADFRYVHKNPFKNNQTCLKRRKTSLPSTH